jgi:succinate dehydrogenase / fumarate reductase, membrane anchor subunit
MVNKATNFSRRGLYDWIAQRASAYILLLYIIFLFGYFISRPEVTYADWQALFSITWVRIFSLVSIASLCAHAWIGLWTIGTDYLTEKMLGALATKARFAFLLACALILFIYFFWCVQILWSL